MQKLGMTALGVLVSASVVAAGPQIKFTSVNAWGGSSSGGPFAVQAIGFTPGGLGLHGAAAGSFITFCVETNEHISNGNTYDVAFNTAAVNGGSGGTNPDPLDSRTAFLYTMFMNGTLDTFGTGFTYPATSSGSALQDAIWHIEEEIAAPSAGSLADKLIALAQSKIDDLSWSGIGNVRVLNLYSNGNHAQDQLVIIPLPTGAGLGLMGLALLGTRRRR